MKQRFLTGMSLKMFVFMEAKREGKIKYTHIVKDFK